MNAYRELKREINTFINSFKRDYYEQFVEKYGGFPDEFVCDQDLLIEKLSILPDPFECYAVLINSQLALDHILNSRQHANEKLIKYGWGDLNEWAKDENYENIEFQLREFGQMGLYLGYGLLFRLSTIRFPLYLKEHDTEHAFYLRFSRKFQDDPVLFERSNTALEYIRKFSLNTFKKKRKSEEIDTDLLEKVNEIIWDQTISKISEDIDESLMRAARGDLEYKYLPNAISNELVELDIEIGKTPATLSLDNPISKDTQKATFKDELTDKTLNAQELIEDLENQKVIQKCRELFDDPDILTNREKQVLQLYFLEDEDYILEDIGKELGIKKQTVHEHKNNAIKKLTKHFKN